eukprot:scaffold17084_cov130-Isochrysis_galbana.AAC.3
MRDNPSLSVVATSCEFGPPRSFVPSRFLVAPSASAAEGDVLYSSCSRAFAMCRAVSETALAALLFIRDVALIIACVTRYTGYEGERLEGPCPHQSSEELVDEDNRGHHNPRGGPEGIRCPW